ncbi:MAG: hypothetical protein ACD_79C01504G0002 [uncultured bacterium]|nr:MAG: hypothetical protein ACD_79C01504G0002 [uncultured bacterium]
MITDSAIISEFIAESRDHLRAIEQDFLILEKQGNKTEPEVINRIFRAIHTIKGASGFLGLKNLGSLAHSMETMLSLVRDKTFYLKPGHVSILLEGVDHLNIMLDDIVQSDKHDVSVIITKLNNLQKDGVSDSTKTAMETRVTIPGSDEFDISSYVLNSIPSDCRELYILSYDLTQFEKECSLSPIQLIKKLLQTGEIVDGFLTGDDVDLSKGLSTKGLCYKVLYATVLGPEIISIGVGLEEEFIKRIDKTSIKPRVLNSAPLEIKSEETKPETSDKTAMPEVNPAPLQENESVSTVVTESVRIRIDILDKLMMLAGELVLVRNQQIMNVDRLDSTSRNIAQRLNIVTSDLQETIMRTRMQPMGNVFGKFNRIVRDLGSKLGKQISIETSGNEVELDKTILEGLTDPLTHIIRNSCDHGIEMPAERQAKGKSACGIIHIRAYHEGGQMNIVISDDGKGIDIEQVKKKTLEKGLKTEAEISRMSEKEAVALIFLPGLSTAKQVNDMSGRGVGMDVVKNGVEKLGGTIDITTVPGKGTEIILRLPLTLAIIPSLIVETMGYRYAIPQINLEELVCLYDENITKIECAGNREVYRLRDILLPMIRLDEVFKHPESFSEETIIQITERNRQEREKKVALFKDAREKGLSSGQSETFAVLKVGDRRFGLVIDRVIGTEEIVVKPMHGAVKNLIIYAGATVLGDGSVALILDVLGFIRHAGIDFSESSDSMLIGNKDDSKQRKSLLLFKSGPNENFGVETTNIRRIERIAMKDSMSVGSKRFITLDGISTLILKLDSALNVSPCEQKDEMFLLLPKNSKKPYGILSSKLVDIGTFDLNINTESYNEPGLLGSAIIRNQMTLLVDMESVVRKAQPEWFTENL